MDDTDKDAKLIAEKWGLPVYFVTKNENPDLEDCKGKACAECLKCYNFPMKSVVTNLRGKKK